MSLAAPIFDALTRGNDKLFLLVRIDRRASNVVARATTSEGELPAQVLPHGHGSCVVVVPQSDLAITVEVTTNLGFDVISSSRVVEPNVAVRESRRNTLLRNRAALAVRNYDQRVGIPGQDLRIVSVQALGENCHIRGELELTGVPSSELEAQAWEICAADEYGRSVVASPWICTGDITDCDWQGRGADRRLISYAIDVPARVGRLVLWARRTDDKAQPCMLVLPGFDGYRPPNPAWDFAYRPDQDPGYDGWFRDHHRASERDLDLQRRAQGCFALRPKFSVIVPLFKTPLDMLDAMARSVLEQTYSNLELVLVNASPEDEGLVAATDALMARDGRVRVVVLEGNEGIALNTAAGIRSATGDFCAFLDHDDLIEPDALYCYAAAINRRPDTDMLYCDEDHLIDGTHALPFFKPDWDEWRILANNYLTHMMCVRTSILDAMAELPGADYDGAQDHNMAMLVGEQARYVAHVPRVLYHWRHSQNSTAGGMDQKPYAQEAQVRSVQEHLDRCEVPARAVMGGRLPGHVDVQPHFKEYPLVSIIIPNKDSTDLLERCVESIAAHTDWPNYEVVVVENNLEDRAILNAYKTLTERFGFMRVVDQKLDGAFSFSRSVNLGVREAHGDYVLTLSNDTLVLVDDWLSQMMLVATRPQVGVVGAKLLNLDGTIQHTGILVGRHSAPAPAQMWWDGADPGYYDYNAVTRRVCAVTGACMLMRKSVYEDLGSMDHESYAIDYGDIDLCMRAIESGLQVVQQSTAVLRRAEGASRDGMLSHAARVQLMAEIGSYRERWGSYLANGDPYYNVNVMPGNLYFLPDTQMARLEL